MLRAALLALALAGCVQVVAPPPGPGASLGALLDAAIAANPPYQQPMPGEYVPPKPPAY
ncbi:hypothetical protein ACQW02_04670 [Humitalea sp. 24SJ18S-53]|uniref:hypothetical protein n=1 Tax=Humitalea sp. 24SJ18S-53 TaxID=3422307 RepID=UPI003D6770E8